MHKFTHYIIPLLPTYILINYHISFTSKHYQLNIMYKLLLANKINNLTFSCIIYISQKCKLSYPQITSLKYVCVFLGNIKFLIYTLIKLLLH